MQPTSRTVLPSPLRTFPARLARRTRVVTLSHTLRDLIVQRVQAPGDHQYGISLVIDRTIDGLMDAVYENRTERVTLFRAAFVDIATNTRTAMNQTDLAIIQEIMDPNTVVPRPCFSPVADITCDLAMVSMITHTAQHIMVPTWGDQFNGIRAHLTQLSTLIAILASAIEKRTAAVDNLREQAICFATRGLQNTFMTTTIFMKPWFDGRSGWQAMIMSVDMLINNMYEDHRKAVMPIAEIAPWNLCLYILNCKFSVSFAYIMAMTCLFDAWCPHNFSAVQWMLAHHIEDDFGQGTIEKQMRLACLMFWLINCNDLTRFPDMMHADLARLRVRLVHIVTEKQASLERGDTPCDREEDLREDPDVDDMGDVLDHTFPGWRAGENFIHAVATRMGRTDPVLLLNPTPDDLPPAENSIIYDMSAFGTANDAVALSFYPSTKDLQCNETLDPESPDIY